MPTFRQLTDDNRKQRTIIGQQSLIITALVSRLAEVSPGDPLLDSLDFLKLDSPYTRHTERADDARR